MNPTGRVASLLAIVAAAAISCASQQRLPAPAAPVQRGAADEIFDLNISERRITEDNFVAATSVGFDNHNGKNLSLNVGVELRADKINVWMRNVTGTVRFRGSIQRILDLINSGP